MAAMAASLRSPSCTCRSISARRSPTRCTPYSPRS
jgi:hypothetical protein